MLFNKKIFLVPYLIIVSSFLFGQTIPLVRSGEVIKAGVLLYDSGRFEDAIHEFKTVAVQDTNYVYMLSELALAYIGAKQYDSAVAVCDRGLQKTSDFGAKLMRMKGTAYDNAGDFEKSISAFEKGIERYPFDFSMHYNLGITYYNKKDFEKAAEYFEKTLRLNPFHTSSHLNLGRLSAFQGKKVRAMMSLGIYMSLVESDNARLVFLENLMNNAVPEEGSFPFEGAYPFDKLDQIIRAKIVLDKNFKSIIPVNAVLTKQYQLLLDQLNLAEDRPDDFWIDFYLPFYKTIHDQNLLEPFLYHILTSTEFKEVEKWKKKNAKLLKEFYAKANVFLKQKNETLIAPQAWKIDRPLKAWYADDKTLDGLGDKDAAGNEIGSWRYYYSNGEQKAIGTYDGSGKKIGNWKYYYANGNLKSDEKISGDSLELRKFTEAGQPQNRYTLVNEKVAGAVEIFYPCGALSERLGYTEDKRNGPGRSFYPDGEKEVTYTFKDDEYEGSYESYYPDGALQKVQTYKDGITIGEYRSFHPNHNAEVIGQYNAKGNATGRWRYYYSNGQLSKEGDYVNDTISGDWTFYNARGIATTKMTYDRNGEAHGEEKSFIAGKPSVISTYDHGKLVANIYYDSAGTVMGKSSDPSGTFPAKGFYFHGPLKFEGAYKNGKHVGEWKFYYPTGQTQSVYAFVDGEIEGDYKEYFKTGKLKEEKAFSKGEHHGYSRSYSIYGKITEEGWYQRDKRQQLWREYYPDGTLESENYYLNGELEGKSFDYNVDGKIYSITTYDKGRVTGIVYYNADGKIRMGKPTLEAHEALNQKYDNGAMAASMQINCGYFEGVTKGWPNGNVLLKNTMRYGRRYGVYQFFTVDGKPEIVGNYLNGDEYGEWKWFHENGTLSLKGQYLRGERDSTWVYYDEREKITDIVQYLDGEKDGVSMFFAPDGTKVLEKMYEGGLLIRHRASTVNGMAPWQNHKGDETIVCLYPNGKKAYTESYKDGLLQGKRTMYYPSGNVYSEYQFDRGDYVGAFSRYYVNGKLQESGNYTLDERDGSWTYYDENGNVRNIENYKLGVSQGKKIWNKQSAEPTEYTYWAGLIIE